MRTPWLPVLALIAVAIVPLPSTTAQELLHNGSFEQPARDDATLPDGWRRFAYDAEYVVRRDESAATEGRWALRVEGSEPIGRAGVSGQTGLIEKPAVGYRLTMQFKGIAARPDFIIRFREAGAPQEALRTHRYQLPTKGQDWQEVNVRVRTPPAALDGGCRIEIILYGRGKCTAWYDDVKLTPLEEWEPEPLDPQNAPKSMMPLRPKEGETVAQNPPDISWPPYEDAGAYRLELSRERDFPGGATIRVENLRLNLYNHHETLAPGTWHWRYAPLDEKGKPLAWTEPMRFVIPEDAVELPLPPIEELRKRLKPHPRLIVTPETLHDFRAMVRATPHNAYEQFLARLERTKAQPLLPEPPRSDTKTEKQSNKYAYPMASAARDLSFGYIITGDGQYADAAKRFILHLCSWDPYGGTGYRQADQSFRKITMDLCYAWDWLQDVLTDEERETLREAIRVRGEILYHDFVIDRKPVFRSRPIHHYPYDSHGITVFGYFVHITLAMLGDLPEAENWFRYIIPAYWNIIPPWGGADGGWCQGTGYWRYSTGGSLEAGEAMRSALGLDIAPKPWFRNNGYFGIYCVPPFLPRLHFGDGNRSRPGYGAKAKLARYAKRYQDPYFQWYAQTEPSKWSLSDWRTLFCYDWGLKPKAPTDLPQAKYFRDIGWVAMHSALWDPQEIMLFFKSSWYGSFNHSHADQNQFVLNAFGEALAIDSGYYYKYGGEHDKGWLRQTKAHNCVLVGGQGQPIFDLNAEGRIAAFVHGADFDYTVGDAAAAYAGALERFDRHIVFARSQATARPDYFVIFDSLRAAKPNTFTWCLHALEQMRVDEAGRQVTIDRSDAHLLVRFAEPAALRFAQTDQFDVPTIDPETYPDQWHLQATTLEETQESFFLTALIPYHTEDAGHLPAVKPLAVEGRHAMEVTWPDGRRDLFAFAPVADGADACQLGPAATDAPVACVRLGKSGAIEAFFAHGGTYLRAGGRELLRAAKEGRMTPS